MPFVKRIMVMSAFSGRLTRVQGALMVPRNPAAERYFGGRPAKRAIETMKVRNSLRSVRKRHRDNRVVRRRGRLYVINKVNRRFKARQG